MHPHPSPVTRHTHTHTHTHTHSRTHACMRTCAFSSRLQQVDVLRNCVGPATKMSTANCIKYFAFLTIRTHLFVLQWPSGVEIPKDPLCRFGSNQRSWLVAPSFWQPPCHQLSPWNLPWVRRDPTLGSFSCSSSLPR